MSIYSANRTGSFNVAQIPANESYKWNDIGRILCESQANDMAFFEAALACDFTEVKGLRESTILEAEAAEVEKANKEKLFDKLIEGLKSFWSKLKGAFQSAINYIAELAISNKQFIKEFNSKVSKEDLNKWTGSIEVDTYDTTNKCVNTYTVKGLDTYNGVDNVGKYLAELLGSDNGNTTVAPKAYTASALSACKKKETLNSETVHHFTALLSNGHVHIKSLKEAQKKAEEAINETINQIKSLKKGSSNDDKDYADTWMKNVHNIEIVASVVTKAAIAVTKEDMKSRRVALRKAMDDILKTDKVLHNSAVLDDMEAFEDTMNAGLPDEETKKEIDALVASV